MSNPNSAYYEQQRRNIRSGYTRELANNAYARFLAQQRGTRERSDMRTSFRQGRQDYNTTFQRYGTDRRKAFTEGYGDMTAEFGARGLQTGGVSSGLKTQGVRDYRQDFRKDLSRNRMDYTRALGRLTRTRRRDIGRSRVNTAQEMNQFDLNQADIRAQRTDALASLRAQRARERAMMAQYLTALQPMLGG